MEWNIHGGPRGDGDGDGLKKYGRFIQERKRMAAVVRELQRGFRMSQSSFCVAMSESRFAMVVCVRRKRIFHTK